MRKSSVLTPVLLGVLGAAAFAPLAASAAPPCPECFYPYRACFRAATTPAEQQACEDEYTQCLQTFCPDPFLTRLMPADRKDSPRLVSRVVRQPVIATDTAL